MLPGQSQTTGTVTNRVVTERQIDLPTDLKNYTEHKQQRKLAQEETMFLRAEQRNFLKTLLNNVYLNR